MNEQNLRIMLQERAESVAAAPVVPEHTVRRVRIRKAVMTGGVAVAAVAIAVAGVFMKSALWPDAAPVPPAEEREEIVPVRNGRIIHSRGEPSWQGNSAPPPPSAAAYYIWEAFEQETESFLFVEEVGSEVWVVGEKGTIAEFVCPPSARCTEFGDLKPAFGPGPDEVTAAVSGNSLPTTGMVQVMGFDGRVRDTLDISAVLANSPGQTLTGLAWSPDGSRLAVSTDPSYGCDPSGRACESNVWIFDRGGGEPQVVFTERTPDDLVEGKYLNHPVLRDLAWSPDGHSLALLVANYFMGDQGGYPRLVTLRLPPGEPVRTDTLHVWDDNDWPKDVIVVPDDYDLEFAFAWSPDGTRIAVTSQGGIAEISAEDGRVLTRHPGEDALGPLAWLRKR